MHVSLYVSDKMVQGHGLEKMVEEGLLPDLIDYTALLSTEIKSNIVNYSLGLYLAEIQQNCSFMVYNPTIT